MVDSEKLNWCKLKKNGIKLIEPNDNLSKEYIKNAEETLDILKTINDKSNMWLATTKYYFEYFTIYSILMKLGIKSEIHECTISLCNLLEEENLIKKETTKNLETDKKLRIDNQYYLKNYPVNINYDELLHFLLETKNILEKITNEQIKNIRSKIDEI